MEEARPIPPSARPEPPRSLKVAGLIGFAILAALLLWWAKWDPYLHRLPAVAATHSLGSSILTGGRGAAPAPSLAAALSYTVVYFKAIWVALVAGLLMAAGVDALIPRAWLLRVLAPGGGLRATVVGGLLAAPSMMCTCCAAPPTVAMRRSGVPLPAALAFWVGNPAINPAVIIFTAFVLPWQWAALRAASGILLVFVVLALITRLLSREDQSGGGLGPVDPCPPATAAETGRRFLKTLLTLTVTLVPEYFCIVMLLGGFRGLLFPAGHALAAAGLLGMVLLAIAGTLFVIPTAGEIPIVRGLLHAGAGAGPAGVLLLTLPAVSLPSAVMMARSLPARVLLALGGAVAVIGILTGLLATAIGL